MVVGWGDGGDLGVEIEVEGTGLFWGKGRLLEWGVCERVCGEAGV